MQEFAAFVDFALTVVVAAAAVVVDSSWTLKAGQEEGWKED